MKSEEGKPASKIVVSKHLEEIIKAKGWKPPPQPDYTIGEGLEDIVRRKGWPFEETSG